MSTTSIRTSSDASEGQSHVQGSDAAQSEVDAKPVVDSIDSASVQRIVSAGASSASAARAEAGSRLVQFEAVDPRPPLQVAWRRSSQTLRVAILGWARMSSQGREGSGYNLSKSELARGLVLSGHSVFYLASGMTNRLKGLKVGPAFIEERERWGPHGAIACYELRNSPNVAPAAFNFRNMATEIDDPGSAKLIVDWLKSIQAQVVHVHSLEGYPLNVIPAIEQAGIPVVVTPHNYWYLCPQVDLLHHEREVCLDYDGGRRCEGCLPGRDVAKLRTTRAWGQTLERRLGLYPADVVRKAVYGAKPFVKALLKGQWSRKYVEPKLNPDVWSDPELALGFESVRRESTRDTTSYLAVPIEQTEQPRDYARAEWDTNERVLQNGLSRVGQGNSGKHRVSLNVYGQRRDAGVAALSAASLVTPPSDYLRKVHVAMGVPEERTRWVRLGQPHFDQINRRVRRSPFYDVRPWDPAAARQPLRFAFFGTTRPNKGLEVLTRAIPLLRPEVRQRCQFVIRAQGHDIGFRKRLAAYPEVSVWCGYDLHQLNASVGEYDVGILSHIWLENSPLVLLENLHAGKMVICSRLGGPVDWVRDPKEFPESHNGLLFAGGNEVQLAACITRLVVGEVAIPSPREIHERTTLVSYPAHVHQIESIYHEVLTRKQRC